MIENYVKNIQSKVIKEHAANSVSTKMVLSEITNNLAQDGVLHVMDKKETLSRTIRKEKAKAQVYHLLSGKYLIEYID